MDITFSSREIRPYAEELALRLKPGCKRIAIAGSLRRGAPMVHDIEIVAEPLPLSERVWFGGKPTANELDRILLDMERNKLIVRYGTDPSSQRWGDRFKQFRLVSDGKILPCGIDLFIVLPPATWGAILALRTGPAEFNAAIMRLVLPRRKLIHEDGYLRTIGGIVLPTDTEGEYFKALGLPLFPPNRRSEKAVLAHLREVKPHPQAEQKPLETSDAPVQQSLF